MRYVNSPGDITDGIDSSLWKSIDKAIDSNSREMFKVLNSFVRSVLKESIDFRSVRHFQQYIFFFPYYYQTSFEKWKYNQSLLRFHKMCADLAPLYLKETITYYIGWKAREQTDVKNRQELNAFFYWAFNAFSRLLYYIVRNKDVNSFRNALNEFEQTTNSAYGLNYDLKFKIWDLKRENTDGSKSEEISALTEQYHVEKKFEDYKRHTLTGIKYWIYYLYQVERINEEEVNTMTEMIQVQRGESEDFFNDLLFFRSGQYSYMGWDNWDFTERQSGKTYSPPDPHRWMTFGVMVDLLKGIQVNTNIEELNRKELNDAQFVHSEFKDLSQYFKNNFEKWKKVISIPTEGELDDRIKTILSSFAAIKRKGLGDRERAIAATPLSAAKVAQFKNSIGTAWKHQTRIRRIFENFGNVELIQDDDVKLKIIGQRTFFEKAKMMFVDGENYQLIYGMETIGGNTGRWEDDEFFSTILKGDFNKVSAQSSIEILDKCIGHLKANGKNPTAIFIPPEYSYKDKEISGSTRFIQKAHTPNEGGLSFFLLGSFDEIPVYTSFSNFLKNKIIVCDFAIAFKMRFKTNPDWFDNHLKVDVRELTNDEVQSKLEENPAKWKKTEDQIELSDEDALTLIKTSVIMEIWSVVDFVVLDNDAYSLGVITSIDSIE